jgi:hypothetical protein
MTDITIPDAIVTLTRFSIQIGIGAVAGPAALAILSQGILTDSYDAPTEQSLHYSGVQRFGVRGLHGNTPQSVYDTQPLPICGFFSLVRQREGAGLFSWNWT